MLPTSNTTIQDSVDSKVKCHQARHELSLMFEFCTEDCLYLSRIASLTQSWMKVQVSVFYASKRNGLRVCWIFVYQSLKSLHIFWSVPALLQYEQRNSFHDHSYFLQNIAKKEEEKGMKSGFFNQFNKYTKLGKTITLKFQRCEDFRYQAPNNNRSIRSLEYLSTLPVSTIEWVIPPSRPSCKSLNDSLFFSSSLRHCNNNHKEKRTKVLLTMYYCESQVDVGIKSNNLLQKGSFSAAIGSKFTQNWL